MTTPRRQDHRVRNESSPLMGEPNAPKATRLVRVVPDAYINRVLPLALSASMAMAATAATTVYAYAFILCDDPLHCKEQEQGRYAGAVALATGIANACGIMTLGPLREAVKHNPKFGMFFWLLCRATSVALLAVAVIFKSIQLAFVGRIFEGLATDNLLHFNLGTIYVSVTEKDEFSRLMNTSLALFMLGMAFSPTIAGLLPSFFTSFVLALSIFAASVLYLAIFVPVVSQTAEQQHEGERRVEQEQGLARRVTSVFRPLVELYEDPGIILPGLTLLLYNATQAYLFPALMVFAALKFSFTGKENGFIISLAAAVSAIYLLLVVTIIPWIRRARDGQRDWSNQENGDAEAATRNTKSTHELLFAMLSMSSQLVALPLISYAKQGWQLYPLTAVIALGLAAPSFIKIYGVSLAKDKSGSVASLAMMESIGGLLSAVVLGSSQSQTGGGAVFLVAFGLVGAAVLAMLSSVLVRSSHPT